MEKETLADYVRRVRNEKDLTLHDIQRRSGNEITNSYVSRIENGYVTNVTPDKLQALAKGLGVPADDLFAIINQQPLQPKPEKRVAALFYKFSEIDEDDLTDMEPIFKMLEAEVDRRIRIKEARHK